MVENLVSAWGVEPQGPDPRKLSGLLELTEEWLQQEGNDPSGVSHHFQNLRNRLVEAHGDRTRALQAQASQLEDALREAGQRNLWALEAVERCLGLYLEAASTGSRPDCWEALGELEEAAAELQTSEGLLAQLLSPEGLRCTRCGSPGSEPLCPACGAERLYLSNSQPVSDQESTPVSREVSELARAYASLMAGRCTFDELGAALAEVELSFQEARELAEQSGAQEGLEEAYLRSHRLLIEHLDAVLEGVERMDAVVESRSASELAQGWLAVFENAVAANRIVVRLATVEDDGETSA